MEHLVLAESAVLEGLDARREGEPLRRTPKNMVAYGFVMLVLRLPVPVKVPSRRMMPSGGRTLAALREWWEENHRELRRRVEGLDPAALRRPVVAHPVAGPMTIGQAVAMLDVHQRRHVGQIRKREELLRATSPASPSPAPVGRPPT